eukprot:TRINITY_DN3344_c0_g1_i4.p1 TRINITY_DN3344_c0_g1~~TRINITY_DN3344_c0_g1_i4.p1  ORF type:complete len:117 (-),score=26.32 TRINITY_DN3344_c0_g1_i4:369-719(-)
MVLQRRPTRPKAWAEDREERLATERKLISDMSAHARQAGVKVETSLLLDTDNPMKVPPRKPSGRRRKLTPQQHQGGEKRASLVLRVVLAFLMCVLLLMVTGLFMGGAGNPGSQSFP